MDPWINGSNNIVCHLQTVHLSFKPEMVANIFMAYRHSSIVLEVSTHTGLESNPSAIFQTTNHLESPQELELTCFSGEKDVLHDVQVQLFCDDM